MTIGPQKPASRTVQGPLRAIVAFLVAGSALGLTSCDAASRAREHEVIVTGSTTVLPIAEIAGKRFGATHGGDKVLVSGVGSSAGIEAAAKGTADIGTSSRELKDEEGELGLVDTPIAYDAIAVIVNPGNPVEGLTKAEIKAIFRGEIVNWSEVGGPDMPIGLVNRDEASGTREAFLKIVMDKEPFERNAVVLPGTGQVRAVVGDAPGAVGYISLGFVTDEVKALAVDGVVPSPETVESGEYPIRRVLHFFTKGEPSGLARAFVDYVLSDEIQEGVVRDAGFLPVEPRGAGDG